MQEKPALTRASKKEKETNVG